MRPPFPSIVDYLQVMTGEFYAGKNEVNLRETFHHVSESTQVANFNMPGVGNVMGSFFMDSGDPGVDEPRIFGEVCKITQVVTGTSIIVRLQINTSWGSATIKINGANPSTFAGVGGTSLKNTISSDSDSHGWFEGSKCIDIVVAENLPLATYTVTLNCNNPGGMFFCYCGMKTSAPSIQPRTLDMVQINRTAGPNVGLFSFRNISQNDVHNAKITLAEPFYQEDGRGFPNGEWSMHVIPAGGKYDIPVTIDGRSRPGADSFVSTLTAEYADDAGAIVRTVVTEMRPGSSQLTYDPTKWGTDVETPNGISRLYNMVTNAPMTFKCNAPYFTIGIQKEYGSGSAHIRVGGTLVATLNCHDEDGGGFLEDVVVATGLVGYGTTATVTITGLSELTPFSMTAVRFVSERRFSAVTETMTTNLNFASVPPFNIANPSVQLGKVAWPEINKTLTDWSIPATNVGVKEVTTYSRFPTYAVYYSTGSADLLSQYDLLVIEPSAVSYAQVQAWRAKGIKVYGYVSFGEEDSERTVTLDLTSEAAGPHRDDGLGPGGYASYYNKGGNLFGEASECGNDCQRTLGLKECAVSNPKYFTGLGRCSPSCSWDYRDGGILQSAGGACPKGYTIENNWQRDPMRACATSTCPDYLPLNQRCTEWVESEIQWGQDFSIATPDFPDQNGIWFSSFINPIAPRWKEKLQTHYLRTVFGLPELNSEVLALQATLNGGGQSLLGCQLSNAPFDDEMLFTVTTVDGSYTFTKNSQFSHDSKSGAISFAPDISAVEGVPLLVAGSQIAVTYYRKGLDCDGVFMDTVDTVDVYPSEEFQTKFVDMVNDLKRMFPNKMFCSNRGFGILDRIIHSCSHVMFESFLSDYNWNTDTYGLITNPGTIEWNNGIKDQLKRLRKDNVFDVLALNYCHNGPAGDIIRKSIYDACYSEGYMCWTSTILLNSPEPLLGTDHKTVGRIRTSKWNAIRKVVV